MASKNKPAKKKAKPAAKSASKAKRAASAKVPAKKPVAKKAAKRIVKPTAKPVSKPTAKAAVKPAAKAPTKPVAKPVVVQTLKKPASSRPGMPPLRPVFVAHVSKGPKPKPLTKKDLVFYKDLLLKLRDRIIDEISFLSNDNLNRSQKESSGDLSSHSFHMADQGTDNFDREFAASLLSNEQDVLYEIDEALRRVEAETYGVCESTGEPIERERLKVLPFARYCVAAQAEMERGKPRFRPFRRTSIQALEPQA